MPQVALTAALDRQSLDVVGGRRFLALTLRAPEVTNDEGSTRRPLNLAFVLDRSGSMAGEKLELVKRAVAIGINGLAATDRAAVVTYDNQVRILAEGNRMTGDAKASIGLALARLRPGGSTALGEGWLTGCRLVAAAAAEHDADWLTRSLLLTDGLANIGITDPNELIGHAVNLRQRGVTTTTFGVGAHFDEQLLRGMAEAGGGNFYFIEPAEQIADFFAGELGELLSVFAEETTLTLTLPDGVAAKLLNDYPASVSTLTPESTTSVTIALGSLSAGEERTIIMELVVPVGTIDDELSLDISLRYQGSDNGRNEVLAATPIVLRYVPTPEAEAESPNLTVIEAAGRLLVARAKFVAWEQMRAGNSRAAHTSLQVALNELNAAALHPAVAALAPDLDELTNLSGLAERGVWDSVTRKRALYDSHTASKGRRDYGKR